jgi:hypothetical protein
MCAAEKKVNPRVVFFAGKAAPAYYSCVPKPLMFPPIFTGL